MKGFSDERMKYFRLPVVGQIPSDLPNVLEFHQICPLVGSGIIPVAHVMEVKYLILTTQVCSFL